MSGLVLVQTVDRLGDSKDQVRHSTLVLLLVIDHS